MYKVHCKLSFRVLFKRSESLLEQALLEHPPPEGGTQNTRKLTLQCIKQVR